MNSRFKTSSTAYGMHNRGSTPLAKGSSIKGATILISRVNPNIFKASENLYNAKNHQQLRSSSRNSFKTQQVASIGYTPNIGNIPYFSKREKFLLVVKNKENYGIVPTSTQPKTLIPTSTRTTSLLSNVCYINNESFFEKSSL